MAENMNNSQQMPTESRNDPGWELFIFSGKSLSCCYFD